MMISSCYSPRDEAGGSGHEFACAVLARGRVNLVKILHDMEERKDAYPQGYRNFLYITNFSRTQQGQAHVVTKVLSLGEEKLAKGLVRVEYTHKHICFSWKVDTNDNGSQSVDADCMLDAAKSLAADYPDDPTACSFSQSALMSEGSDGEIQTLDTTVANINWAYSVLWSTRR